MCLNLFNVCTVFRIRVMLQSVEAGPVLMEFLFGIVLYYFSALSVVNDPLNDFISSF